jgi:general secretion pathway protein C
MSLSAPSLWWPRLVAFVLSALVAASAVAWGLRIGGEWHFAADVVAPAAASAQATDSAAVARALGHRGDEQAMAGADAVSTPVLESSRFVLQGVLDQVGVQGGANHVSHGTALLAIDGQPAKPVAVGAALVDGWTVQSVQGRSAVLERQGNRITLGLPALPPSVGLSFKNEKID